MLADGSVFTCEEKVNAANGIILQDANKVSEKLNSQIRVVNKLEQDMILGCDWFQSVNSQADWFSYGVTFQNGFAAAGIPVHCTVKVKLYSFKALMHLIHTNKISNTWFTFFQQISGPQELNGGILCD